MNETMIIGFISLGFLMLINIVAVAFSYGRLKEKVEDLATRVRRLENLSNNVN